MTRPENTEAPSALQVGPPADPAKALRKPRADSVRNRERVLEAAKAVFAAGGPDGSLEEVARQAGVGVGTLYRHFPTRQTLFDAVYRREVEQLVHLAEQLAADPVPVDALRRWMHEVVEFVATKKGMSSALAIVVTASSDLSVNASDRLGTALGDLVRRAAESGAIRADIGPDDLLRTLIGLCYMHERPDWKGNVLRLVDVFVDGLANGRTERAHAV